MTTSPVVTHTAWERRAFIGGAWQDATDARTFAVHNPATGAVLDEVADCGAEESAAAVEHAAAAMTGWRAMTPRARSEILYRAFHLMRDHADRLADLMVLENGKALADARAEVSYAAEFFRWFAEEAVRVEGSYHQAPDGDRRTVVVKMPVGVAVLITPWNFPAAMATRKIAPALAAGCTVVLKPAPETPLTALAIAQLLAEAEVPPGVVNVLPTSRAETVVAPLLADSRVRKLSFTGSTAVGTTLLKRAADQILNSSMELGGTAPFIVCADADVDAAVAGALVAKMRNGGQACTAANAFYVHRDVLADFTERFGAAMAALRCGPGLEEGTDVGPLINWAAVEKVTTLVNEAVAGGATVAYQGAWPAGGGSFYPPTVLTDVAPSAAILSTEVFGPVAPIVPYEDDAELVSALNAGEYGLVAYIYTRDTGHALRVSEAMETGMVGINRGLVSDPAAPFGGMKRSGLGREGAHEGIEAFLETRYLALEGP